MNIYEIHSSKVINENYDFREFLSEQFISINLSKLINIWILELRKYCLVKNKFSIKSFLKMISVTKLSRKVPTFDHKH